MIKTSIRRIRAEAAAILAPDPRDAENPFVRAVDKEFKRLDGRRKKALPAVREETTLAGRIAHRLAAQARAAAANSAPASLVRTAIHGGKHAAGNAAGVATTLFVLESTELCARYARGEITMAEAMRKSKIISAANTGGMVGAAIGGAIGSIIPGRRTGTGAALGGAVGSFVTTAVATRMIS